MYIVKQYRKKTTKLQQQLIDKAKKLVADEASIDKIHNVLDAEVKRFEKENPTRKEQTYISYIKKGRYADDTQAWLGIRDAGGDFTILSITEEE